jgi:plastocyanin
VLLIKSIILSSLTTQLFFQSSPAINMKFLFAITSLASVALAQYDYGSTASSSSSASSTSSSSASSTSSGSSTIHTVAVGSGGLVFSPDTITAAAGDQVQFVFSGLNHTVTQSTFNAPCNPSSEGFFSGFTGSTVS